MRARAQAPDWEFGAGFPRASAGIAGTARPTSLKDRLHQLHLILQPLARAVVCLESTASTPGDVYHLWISVQATLHDLFLGSDRLGGLAIPRVLVSDICALVNGRFAEFLEGPEKQVYLTAFFLDFRYIGSKIFTQKHANPLATTITVLIPFAQEFPNYSGDLHKARVGDQSFLDEDLRQKMPAYTKAGQCLADILMHEVNCKCAPNVLGLYATWEAIQLPFRAQFIQYSWQTHPFNKYHDSATPLAYWKKISAHEDAQIVAYLAVKLFSVVPNSMAEERTVSAFTKINSSDRGRQNAETVVSMTRVLQHEQRKKSKGSKVALTIFRELPGLMRSTDRLCAMSEPEESDTESEQGSDDQIKDNGSENSDTGPSAVAVKVPTQNDEEYTDEIEEWELEAGLDEDIEVARPGDWEQFEVVDVDGVDLTNPFLIDMLSDKLID
ncbi:hypothetical protein BDV93DRAFT_562652 [Ceratobasidium sp. AG-I]|nr:hypothetical protein BDV93DRAFT_562652 [Ceratobasidium sp. AG-I]